MIRNGNRKNKRGCFNVFEIFLPFFFFVLREEGDCVDVGRETDTVYDGLSLNRTQC